MDMLKSIEIEQEFIINEMKEFDRTSQEYMVLMQRLVDITETKRDEAEAKYFETQENAIKEKAEEFIKKVAERLDKVEYQLKEYIEDEEDEKDKKVVRIIGFA